MVGQYDRLVMTMDDITAFVTVNSVEDISHVATAKKQDVNKILSRRLVAEQRHSRDVANGVEVAGSERMCWMQHRLL